MKVKVNNSNGLAALELVILFAVFLVVALPATIYLVKAFKGDDVTSMTEAAFENFNQLSVPVGAMDHEGFVDVGATAMVQQELHKLSQNLRTLSQQSGFCSVSLRGYVDAGGVTHIDNNVVGQDENNAPCATHLNQVPQPIRRNFSSAIGSTPQGVRVAVAAFNTATSAYSPVNLAQVVVQP